MPQSCTSGQVAKVDGSGNWQCAADNNATYNGTNFATSGQDCPAGQFATGIDANGNLKCAQPTVGELQGSPCTVNGHTSTLQVSTDGTSGDVSMTCPPNFLVGVEVSGGRSADVMITDDTTNAGVFLAL